MQVTAILRDAIVDAHRTICIVARNPEAIWFDDYEDRVIYDEAGLYDHARVDHKRIEAEDALNVAVGLWRSLKQNRPERGPAWMAAMTPGRQSPMATCGGSVVSDAASALRASSSTPSSARKACMEPYSSSTLA